MPLNGCGIWNERPMPMRQRCSGASAVMSEPAKSTRPASGRTLPLTMPNSVVLPAPFGPMMPSASPSPSARSMASATTMAPKRLLTFSSARSGAVIRLRQQFQLAADWNVRRRFVFGDDKLEGVALALPLAGDERRLGDVLHRLAGPFHRPDHRMIVGGHDGIEDGFRFDALGPLEDVDRHFEQRVLIADRLRPGPLGRARIG